MSSITPSRSLPKLLERHRAFWDRSDVDEPLVRVTHYSPLEEREPLPLADGSEAEEGDLLTPDRISVDRITRHRETFDALDGDSVRGVGPYDLCWTEAIAGCPIRWRTGHVWAEPFLEDLSNPDTVRVADDNPWLTKLSAITGQLVDHADGRYPVTQPLLRGPIDIAAAAIGDEQVCLAAMEEPELTCPHPCIHI